jgi:hypothetical protein
MALTNNNVINTVPINSNKNQSINNINNNNNNRSLLNESSSSSLIEFSSTKFLVTSIQSQNIAAAQQLNKQSTSSITTSNTLMNKPTFLIKRVNENE